MVVVPAFMLPMLRPSTTVIIPLDQTVTLLAANLTNSDDESDTGCVVRAFTGVLETGIRAETSSETGKTKNSRPKNPRGKAGGALGMLTDAVKVPLCSDVSMMNF